jgi:hypothetical protein
LNENRPYAAYTTIMFLFVNTFFLQGRIYL